MRRGGGRRRWAPAALWVCLALATGCGGGGGDTGKTDTERDYLRVQLQRALEQVEGGIRNNPLQFEMYEADARRIRAQAQRAGFGDIAQRASELQIEARKAFERGVDRAVSDAIAKARALVRKGRFNDAYAALRVPDAVLAKPEFARQIASARREVVLASRARKVYEEVIDPKLYQMELAGKFLRAQGLLESFFLVEPFRSSPVASEVKEALAAIEPKAAKEKKAREAERSAKWIPAFYGHPEGKDLAEWVWSDDLLAGPEVSKGIATLAHTGERKRTFMLYGGRDWVDYIVDVEVERVKGAVSFDFRGEPQGEGEDAPLRWVPGPKFDEAELPEGRFIPIRFEVRGEGVTWQIFGDEPEVGGKALSTRRGPFQIRVENGSVVRIKSVFVKVLRRASSDSKTDDAKGGGGS